MGLESSRSWISFWRECCKTSKLHWVCSLHVALYVEFLRGWMLILYVIFAYLSSFYTITDWSSLRVHISWSWRVTSWCLTNRLSRCGLLPITVTGTNPLLIAFALMLQKTSGRRHVADNYASYMCNVDVEMWRQFWRWTRIWTENIGSSRTLTEARWIHEQTLREKDLQITFYKTDHVITLKPSHLRTYVSYFAHLTTQEDLHQNETISQSDSTKEHSL
jgi:hypothetical protein